MELDGDILCVKIFSNEQKVLITSSSFRCFTTAKKVVGFLGVLLNISKSAQLIFIKLISFLGIKSIKKIIISFHKILVWHLRLHYMSLCEI